MQRTSLEPLCKLHHYFIHWHS